MASIVRAALALSLVLFCGRVVAEDVFPGGDPMTDIVAFEYAVYYLPKHDGDTASIVRAEAQALDPHLEVLPALPKQRPRAPIVAMHMERDVPVHYRAPDMRSLQYFGRGISREQAQAVQGSQEALVLDFAHPKAHVWEGLRVADALVENVARRTGGLIWDESTRLLYTPDEWRKQLIDTWAGAPPKLSQHFTVHAYQSDTYERAITLGMAKFGLPDIVVDQFSWSDQRSVGTLINLLAQVLAEGARLPADGNYDLSLDAIRSRALRDAQLATLRSGATKVAHLRLLRGRPDDGDPNNRLLEIGFDRYAGATVQERQDAMLAAFFGADDSVARVKHSAELLAASEKARQRLPALQQAFKAGLQPGDFIDLKAPFDASGGGHEYMWVEVTAWEENGKIQGLLRNEPEHVPGLHAGAIVHIEQATVFDYILRHADGSREGNETSRLIEEMQKVKENP